MDIKVVDGHVFYKVSFTLAAVMLESEEGYDVYALFEDNTETLMHSVLELSQYQARYDIDYGVYVGKVEDFIEEDTNG